MDIKWKVTTAGELRSERLARLLARLILDGEDTLSDMASPRGCGGTGGGGRNEEISSTQEVSS